MPRSPRTRRPGHDPRRRIGADRGNKRLRYDHHCCVGGFISNTDNCSRRCRYFRSITHCNRAAREGRRMTDTARIENPGAAEVTITVTMELHRWRDLLDQLNVPSIQGSYPAYRLRYAI